MQDGDGVRLRPRHLPPRVGGRLRIGNSVHSQVSRLLVSKRTFCAIPTTLQNPALTEATAEKVISLYNEISSLGICSMLRENDTPTCCVPRGGLYGGAGRAALGANGGRGGVGLHKDLSFTQVFNQIEIFKLQQENNAYRCFDALPGLPERLGRRLLLGACRSRCSLFLGNSGRGGRVLAGLDRLLGRLEQ